MRGTHEATGKGAWGGTRPSEMQGGNDRPQEDADPPKGRPKGRTMDDNAAAPSGKIQVGGQVDATAAERGATSRRAASASNANVATASATASCPMAHARAKAAPKTPRTLSANGLQPAEDIAAAQTHGKGKGKRSTTPAAVQAPFVPPSPPRTELVGREQALLKKVGEFDAKNPMDPRLEKARESSEATQQEHCGVGGASPQKLCFAQLEANKPIARGKEEVAQAEKEVKEAKENVRLAVAEQIRVEEVLTAKKELLRGRRSRRAHLTFQAAREGGQHVSGYGELAESVAYVDACYLQASAGGRESRVLGGHLGNSGRFIRQFDVPPYDEGNDPVLLGLASNSSDTIYPGGPSSGKRGCAFVGEKRRITDRRRKR